jgi:hypothetical protein
VLRSSRYLIAGVCMLSVASFSSFADASVPRHAEQVNNCSDRNVTYFFSTLGEVYTWTAPDGVTRYDNIANDSVQLLAVPKAQDGSQLVTLTRNPNNSSGEVKFRRTNLPTGTFGRSECNWPNATIQIDNDMTSNAQLWQVAAHEMLHLLGAEHGGRRDAFYPAAENHNDNRMMTCVSSSVFPNYAAHETDTVAHLSYLWDPAANRQLMADNGFENGFSNTWWVIGSGAMTTGNSTNPVSGARRGYFAPPSNTSSQSVQWRVRMVSGSQTEQYRINAYVAPEASTTVTNVTLELIHRTQTYPTRTVTAGSCNEYFDGLNAVDVNAVPTPGAWTVVRLVPKNNLVSGWTSVTSTWYQPPTSHAHDLSLRLYGYADRPNTAAAGNILLDNMTIEGT